MKRLINIILALLLLSTPVIAADVKLSELPAASSMATGDIIPFTSDPGGTPVSKNITRENFALDMHSLLPLLPIATAAGTVDAITADYTPNVALTDQKMVAFVATGANTSTTPTFSPDGLTARTIVKFGGGALVAGDIPAALAVCIVQYNLANTRWELLNPAHGKYLTGGTNTFNLTNGTASLDVAAGAAVDIDGNLKVGSTGSVLIGDTTNSFVTLGLTVNQGAADDEILSLKSSDVGHTVTTDTEADTYGLFKKTSATAGGLTIRGLTDSDAEGALTLEGIIGATDPTDTNAALVLIGSKQTGTTTAALAAAEEVLQIKNRTTDLVTVLGNGNVGIGTASPREKFDVAGNIVNSYSDNTKIGFQYLTGSDYFGGLSVSSSTRSTRIDAFSADSTSNIIFRTGTVASPTTAMTILYGGNVGIGTTNPNQLLTVENSMSLKEIAAANADTAAYGQIWVANSTPNELWFTDDAGTDTQISSHPLDAPPSMYNYGPGIDWVGKRVQNYLGIIFWQTLDGVVTEETFDAYNLRRAGVPGHVDKVKRDWNTVQAAARDKEIEKRIIEKMGEEVEVSPADAVESVEVMEDVKVEGKPKKVYKLNPATGKIEHENVKTDGTKKVGTGKYTSQLKAEHRLDVDTGKTYRKKTRAEAEAQIVIPEIEPMPQWIKAKLEKK